VSRVKQRDKGLENGVLSSNRETGSVNEQILRNRGSAVRVGAKSLAGFFIGGKLSGSLVEAAIRSFFSQEKEKGTISTGKKSVLRLNGQLGVLGQSRRGRRKESSYTFWISGLECNLQRGAPAESW